MALSPFFACTLFLLGNVLDLSAQEVGQDTRVEAGAYVPPALQPWVDWVLEESTPEDVPRVYSDAAARLPLWTSRLDLDANESGGVFELEVEAFAPVVLPLPGGGRIWPGAVTVDGLAVPVLDRDGRPIIRLETGKHKVGGTFEWPELPRQIWLPSEIGLLALSVNGEAEPNPAWKPDGTLWLQRQAASQSVEEDFLSVRVHSLLEDGTPLWFETRIEVIVSGKSREETLGAVLPEGWSLSSIDAPIPVAVDDSGHLKAQLRAGRWSITLRAFQNQDTEAVSFAGSVSPVVTEQSLSYRAAPSFRQAEITGLPQIDIAQTQVPEVWRDLPVYRWNTGEPFRIEERIRGTGERGAAPLKITRSLWLDDGGKLLTYQDQISASPRKIRRLDAAEGHMLGSVSVDGEPQLITHNPEGGAPGFEVRSPQLTAVATGQIEMDGALAATGWKSNAESLTATLELPPGYRLLALFGVDYSKGDWLTSWTLLDLFILLLFTLAIFRLCGLRGAVVAFFAFGLAYHEAGAPRLPWLLLLVPVALAALLPEGTPRKVATIGKWVCAAILLLVLIPFSAKQIQGAVFPQLERSAAFSPARGFDIASSPVYEAASDAPATKKSWGRKKANLKADPQAVIQTGPGVPTWSWRTITFGWEGPVSASQDVRMVLIPPLFSRLLAVVRVLGLVGLLFVLLTSARKRRKPNAPASSATSSSARQAAATGLVLFSVLLFPRPSLAQFPEQGVLDELRERLTAADDTFPGAADIPTVDVKLSGNSLDLEIEFHAAARCAAPVPFPLGAAVPTSASFDTGERASLVRKQGSLWVLLPSEGIHRLRVASKLWDTNDWEWGFSLKPKRIEIDAPGWTVSGVRPDGTSENQILFSRASRDGAATEANYDRPDTRHALLVKRTLELGLVWRVTTEVSRLSPTGRAVVVRIPVLPGEKVVSSGHAIEGGEIEVRLGPGAESVAWDGELTPSTNLVLAAKESAGWSEQWRLVASSVWNVSFSGLSPTYIAEEDQLVPFWQPWPGETTTIEASRPKAVAGEVVTIDSVTHSLKPGRRQTTSKLEISLRTSLGEDFAIGLPDGAEIVSLAQSGRDIPVRKEGAQVIIPLKPGAQSVAVEWRDSHAPGGWTRSDAVTLPVGAANVTTIVRPPSGQWLLLTEGPLRGPAVRFWGLFAFVFIIAVVLSRVPNTPLGVVEWALLATGLTQVPVGLGFVVVGWLFMLKWRGSDRFQALPKWGYNISQLLLVFLTVLSVGIFIGVASAGLLGSPEMYIAGNGSSARYLQWYTARAGAELPQPGYWSVSIWWYRIAMLAWALWLSAALVRWIRLGWNHFTKGGIVRGSLRPKKDKPQPPAIPES